MQGVSSPRHYRLDAAVLCTVPTTSYFWSSGRTNRLAGGGLCGRYGSRIDDGDGAFHCGFSRQQTIERVLERSLQFLGTGESRSRSVFLEAAR